ncbi:UNVERIFIED_CONTAM: hypothetical protein RMT77_010537 [Armadillidium vulgare]
MFTDSEIYKSITSISEWIRLHNHSVSLKDKKIYIRGLAIGVPGECLFPELGIENQEATNEEEKGILVYSDNNDKYLWLNSSWHHVENVLNVSSAKAGWVMIDSLWERLIMLTLTQLDYSADETEEEVPYGCCPLNDPAYLLWQNNKPVGMCSLKLKGTSVWGGEEKYLCDTLDTLYVRPMCRRQGHTINLLYMLTSQLLPGEYFGLSYPISLSMCKVLFKFMQLYPSLRDTLWTLDEEGEVSGTVRLMLGTLIVENVLPKPVTNSNFFHNERNGDLMLTDSRSTSDIEVSCELK